MDAVRLLELLADDPATRAKIELLMLENIERMLRPDDE